MNNMNLRKYLLRTSAGEFWRIHPKNNNIVISKNLRDSSWSNTLTIKDMYPCFCADLDSNDNIHILSQDMNGNLLYHKMIQNHITKIPVLKSQFDIAFDRSLFMLQRASSPIFFYTVRKDTGSMLVYQTFWKNKPILPSPIAYIPETINPFWISYIDKKTALILYPRVSGLYIQICSRTLGLESLLLSPQKILTNEDANCEMPKGIVFQDGNLHLLYCIRKNGKVILKYSSNNINSIATDIPQSQNISSSLAPFRKYSLEYSNNKLNVNWLENGYVYYREKDLNDGNFSSPSILRLNNVRTVEYYSYKSNTSHEQNIIYHTEEPISFDNRVLHAFYRENFYTNKTRQDKSLDKNTENKDPKLSSSDTILKLVTGLLANQVVSKNSKQNNNAKAIQEIISELTKNINISNDEQPQNNATRAYKLHKFQEFHRFKAAKEN